MHRKELSLAFNIGYRIGETSSRHHANFGFFSIGIGNCLKSKSTTIEFTLFTLSLLMKQLEWSLPSNESDSVLLQCLLSMVNAYNYLCKKEKCTNKALVILGFVLPLVRQQV